MGDIFKAIGDGATKIWNESGKELGRINDRTAKNIERDADQITKGIKKHGIAGGIADTIDVFSPGHLTAEAADDLFNIHDPKLKQGIAGAVNLGVGAFAGPVGIVWMIDGFAEIGDAVSGPGKPSASQQPPPPSQGMAQTQARNDELAARNAHAGERKEALKEGKREAMIEAAKEKAKDKARERTAYMHGYQDGVRAEAGNHWRGIPELSPGFMASHPHGGYGAPTYGSDGPGLGGASGSGGVTINIGTGGSGGDLAITVDQHFGNDKTSAAKDKISEILNNKNLSFEDMIFQLMLALEEEGQGDVEELGKKLEAEDAEADKTRKGFDDQLTKLNGQLQNEKDPGKRQTLQNQIEQVKSDSTRFENKEGNSRQKLVDQLKNKIDKMTEMQQALSAVLNSMHENAMNTIRNIK